MLQGVELVDAIADAAFATQAWRDIKTAPYSTPVEVKLGHMTIVASLWPDASMTDEEETCDQWRAEYEGEHPEDWSDGACWSSNADEVMSMQPEAWRPIGKQVRP